MHHWLEDEKLPLYQKIYRALKPGGIYIEGDYVVEDSIMEEMLERYDQLKNQITLMLVSSIILIFPFPSVHKKDFFNWQDSNR